MPTKGAIKVKQSPWPPVWPSNQILSTSSHAWACFEEQTFTNHRLYHDGHVSRLALGTEKSQFRRTPPPPPPPKVILKLLYNYDYLLRYWAIRERHAVRWHTVPRDKCGECSPEQHSVQRANLNWKDNEKDLHFPTCAMEEQTRYHSQHEKKMSMKRIISVLDQTLCYSIVNFHVLNTPPPPPPPALNIHAIPFGLMVSCSSTHVIAWAPGKSRSTTGRHAHCHNMHQRQ